MGITWLRQYNPDIDWENATLKWRDETSSTLQLHEILMDNTINNIYESEDPDYDEILKTLIKQTISHIDFDDYYEEINVKQNTSQQLFNKDAENKKRQSDAKKAVPKKFHKFLKVFSKTESEKLPHRREWDHKIETTSDFVPKRKAML